MAKKKAPEPQPDQKVRKIILLVLELRREITPAGPTTEQLVEAFELKGLTTYPEFRRTLQHLLDTGKVVRSENGSYSLR